ncbi:hypothetical protein M885DRAFT_517370 [Pelagophyceae sp. CCMP2097]|nr:hypothetical protein M885DRAFT_517370 [Pelagophyceae sp. CCMP2097]
MRPTSPKAPAYSAAPRNDDERLAPPATSNPKLVWFFRVIHFGLCVMMSATGAMSLLEFGSVNGNQLSQLFLSLYLLLLSTIWFTFEGSTLMHNERVVAELKRNFGFLYHPIGKALFIIFCAFLNFGVQERLLGFFTGCFMCVDGVMLLVLYWKYPNMYPMEAQ